MEKCQYGEDSREMLKKVEERIDKSEERLNGNLERVWGAIDKMSAQYINRLPGWATFAISFLTMVAGALVAGMVRKW